MLTSSPQEKGSISHVCFLSCVVSFLHCSAWTDHTRKGLKFILLLVNSPTQQFCIIDFFIWIWHIGRTSKPQKTSVTRLICRLVSPFCMRFLHTCTLTLIYSLRMYIVAIDNFIWMYNQSRWLGKAMNSHRLNIWNRRNCSMQVVSFIAVRCASVLNNAQVFEHVLCP